MSSISELLRSAAGGGCDAGRRFGVLTTSRDRSQFQPTSDTSTPFSSRRSVRPTIVALIGSNRDILATLLPVASSRGSHRAEHPTVENLPAPTVENPPVM